LFLVFAAVACADDVTVDWKNWDDRLYEADGTELRARTNRFQLVLDMNGDTDVGAMISNTYWAIGSEDSDTGMYGANDDVTFTNENANWVFAGGWGGVLGTISSYNENTNGSKRFYFRFFNAAQQAAATQGGLIYNTAGTWVTAATALDLNQAIADLGRMGAESGNLGGSTDGIHLDGWATMRAPVDPDQDGDGLPDVWEIHYLGGTNASPDGHGDTDIMTNIEEFRAGTDPTNAASVFELWISVQGEDVLVTFFGRQASGEAYEGLQRFYRLEYASGLVENAWTNVPGYEHSQGANRDVVYTNSSPETRFFRAEVTLE